MQPVVLNLFTTLDNVRLTGLIFTPKFSCNTLLLNRYGDLASKLILQGETYYSGM